MVTEWIDTTIGDQIILQRGFDITKKEQRPGTVPVVSSGGAKSCHNTATVKGPGVVLGRKGVVGSVYYIDEDFWAHDTTLWVKDFNGNHPRFVYYFFKWQAPLLASLDVGSANPTLNRNHVHPTQILWPQKGVQKAIAHILGSLDDRIELNRRMNETLEGMAQALFKSWFVDFDPVLDNALASGKEIPPELREKAEARRKLRNSEAPLHPLPKDIRTLFPDEFTFTNEMGWIPKGWEIKISSKLCDVRDGTHDSPKQASEGKHLITSRHITGGIIDFEKAYFISEDDFEQVNRRSKVDSFDILLTMIGTVGVPLLVLENEINFAIKNIGLFKVGIDKRLAVFFFLYLKTSFMVHFLESRIAGTTQRYLSLKILRSLPVLTPPNTLIKYAGKELLPIFEKIHANNTQNKNLSKLRDTLLPKLLSGEIRIPDAEKLVEAVG